MINQLRAEFYKIFSLRSSWILLVATFIVNVGFALLGGWSMVLMQSTMEDAGAGGDLSQMQGLEFYGTAAMHGSIARSGAELGILLIGVLAILMMAGEHASGSIRSSLLAQPRRWVFYLSKTIAMGVVGVITTAISLVVSHYAVYGFVNELGGGVGLFDSEVLRQYSIGLLYTLVIVLLGIGFGALLRNSAGAIVMLFVVAMVLPILWLFFPEGWISDIGDYLPSALYGTVLLTENPEVGPTREVAALALSLWGLVVLIAGGFRLQKSDIK